jgi:tetratricopeptide (TPR) repeat protein
MDRYRCILFILIALAGCGKEPSPEQLAADQALIDARVALGKGSYEEANRLFHMALALDSRLDRAAPMAEAYKALGAIHAARADYDSAFAFYTGAVEQYHSLADRESVRRMTIDIAGLRRMRGQERLAYAQLEEALRLARVFGDSVGVREVEMAILPSCRLLDIRDTEASAVNDLLKAYAAPSQSRSLAAVYDEVGQTQLFRREYTRAAEHFLRAFVLADQAHDSLHATESLLHVGVAFEAAGRMTEAFQSYSDAIRRADRLPGAASIRSELLTRVGNANLWNKQLDQAKRFYSAALSSALKSGNKLAESYLALQLALCDLDRNPDQAVRSCRSVTDFFIASGYPRGLSYASLCLGTALERAGKVTDATQAYRTAVQHFEGAWAYAEDDLYAECEQAYFGRHRGKAYDALLDLLLRTGQFEQAFLIVQRKHSWELRRTYGVQELRRVQSPAVSGWQELEEAVASRVGAEREMANLLEHAAQDRLRAGAIRTVLEKSAQAVSASAEAVVRANAMYEPYVRLLAFGFSDVQRRLGSGRTLVWYVPVRRSLYAYVISPSRVSVQLSAIEREKLLSTAAEFDLVLRRSEAHGDTLSKISTPLDYRSIELLQRLYEGFVRPIDGDISSATNLLLVMPPELSAVPVHALRRTPISGSPYLTEQKTVSYTPGVAWIGDAERGVTAVKNVVGLGYAGTTSWDVEYELRDIRAFYKEARLYFGQQAAFSSVQNEKGDVLHLAVEARYTDQAPWNAGVLLSDGKSLTTRTTVPLCNLLLLPKFPVVVLSNLAADQPQISAAAAPLLLSSGARMVVCNTYTPSRKLKKYFGEVFYTALLGGATPEQAFRKAQQDMARNPEFSSPLVWSSFFLWGR